MGDVGQARGRRGVGEVVRVNEFCFLYSIPFLTSLFPSHYNMRFPPLKGCPRDNFEFMLDQ